MRDDTMDATPILGALLAGGCVLLAYNLGYRSGFHAGKSQGFDHGKKEGSREGAKRGFAVGYDRGKRATTPADEDEDEGETADVDSAHTSVRWKLLSGVVLLIVGLYMWYLSAAAAGLPAP